MDALGRFAKHDRLREITCGEIACEQAYLPVTRASGEKQSDPAGRSLVKRRQESEPALMSVICSFLLHPSEVKHH